MHRMRFLHRDMKAANILVTSDGVIKLADFGLSRMLLQQKNVSRSFLWRVMA